MNMPTPLPLALVTTTGAQDVKIWTAPADGESGANNHASCCALLPRGRRFQQLLLDHARGASAGEPAPSSGTPGYRFVLPGWFFDGHEGQSWRTFDLTAGPAAEPPQASADLLAELRGTGDSPRPHARQVLLDGDGRLLLRAAKIDGLLNGLLHEQDKGALRVDRSLFLTTLRAEPAPATDPRQEETSRRARDRYRNEPFAAGELLARWLSELFGLVYGGENPAGADHPGRLSWWCNYLYGLQAFEGQPGTEDHPLHRLAAHRVDDAIRRLLDGFDGHTVFSSTGGFDALKPCVLGSLALRAPGRHYEHPETEDGGTRITRTAITEPPAFVAPVRSLELRAECADLISRGEILASRAVASVLPRGEQAHNDIDWIEAVLTLAALFDGEDLLSRLYGGPLPASPAARRILELGFRVEAALQGKETEWRLPAALVDTTALADVVLSEVMVRALAARGIATVDETTGEVRHADRDADAAQDLPGGIRKCLKPGKSLRIFGDTAKGCREWLRSQGAPWGTAGGALDAFEQMLRHELSGNNLRGLRNVLAHAALSAEQHRLLRRLADPGGDHPGARLWNLGIDGPLEPGERFLAQPATAALLRSVGIEDADALYRDVLGGVLARLRGPLLR